jgi:hypothetical protein
MDLQRCTRKTSRFGQDDEEEDEEDEDDDEEEGEEEEPVTHTLDGITFQAENGRDMSRFLERYAMEVNAADGLQLPATAMPAERLRGTCFDFMDVEDKDIQEYVREPDNLVIINDAGGAVCLSRDTIRQTMADIYMYFVGCLSYGEYTDELYVRLSVPHGVYVRVREVLAALRGTDQVYKVDATGQRYSRAASFRNAFSTNTAYISAWHCQEGTDMAVSALSRVVQPQSRKRGREGGDEAEPARAYQRQGDPDSSVRVHLPPSPAGSPAASPGTEPPP